MYVKYAKFNDLNVKHLAELPLSFWRKKALFTLIHRYMSPIKYFSTKNMLNVNIRDIITYSILLIILPITPIIIELIARQDMKEYIRLSKNCDNIFVSDFEVFNFKIPKHWEKPSRYYQ